MYNFEKISIECINREEYYNFENKSIFTTIPWIKFLIEDNPGSVPVVIRISNENKLVGYFTAVKIKKVGITIIGSPFRGWGTSWMGLDILDKDEIIPVYDELIPYIFKEYRCSYISISERNLSVEEARSHFKTISADSLELNVDLTDEELFKVFKTDCRNFIRQFERRGATLEIANPDEKFVDEFYNQLIDVFDKQGMNPTWSKEKITRLLKNLAVEKMVLCLRIIDPDGNCIAGSIFPGFNDKFFFWAGASYRTGQHYRPNEYMIWTAIKHWRDNGAKYFDMVGVRDYKKKFGSHEIHYAMIEFAHPIILIHIKNIVEKLYYKSLRWRHKDKRGK